MQPALKDYNYILENFGEEKVRERFVFIADNAKAFIRRVERDSIAAVDAFRVSHAIIEDLVLDYFADISRLKGFHNIEKTHPQKVAAYTSYWVHRRKPIQMIRDVDDQALSTQENIKYVNEAFAASVLISMTYDLCRPVALPGYDSSKFADFKHNLIYFMIYRAVNPQALELMLVALDATSVFKLLSEA